MIFSDFASNSTCFYLLNTSIKILEIGITLSHIKNSTSKLIEVFDK